MEIKIKVTEGQAPAYAEFLRAVLLADNMHKSERMNNRECLGAITKAINAYALAIASDPATCTKQAEYISAEIGSGSGSSATSATTGTGGEQLALLSDKKGLLKVLK